MVVSPRREEGREGWVLQNGKVQKSTRLSSTVCCKPYALTGSDAFETLDRVGRFGDGER